MRAIISRRAKHPPRPALQKTIKYTGRPKSIFRIVNGNPDNKHAAILVGNVDGFNAIIEISGFETGVEVKGQVLNATLGINTVGDGRALHVREGGTLTAINVNITTKES